MQDLKKRTPEPERMERLNRMYRLHQSAVQSFLAVCAPGCAVCCTCNVTLTSLECELLLAGMDQAKQQQLKTRVHTGRSIPRFQPGTTVNRMARQCMEGRDPETDTHDPGWGTCPLLTEDRCCSVYDQRPLACRMMISTRQCTLDEAARMPDRAVTVNHLFMQAVEHLDSGGVSGNLTDMILSFDSSEPVPSSPGSGADMDDVTDRQDMPVNEPMPVLMVPPEHREALTPMVQALSRLLSGPVGGPQPAG